MRRETSEQKERGGEKNRWRYRATVETDETSNAVIKKLLFKGIWAPWIRTVTQKLHRTWAEGGTYGGGEKRKVTEAGSWTIQVIRRRRAKAATMKEKLNAKDYKRGWGLHDSAVWQYLKGDWGPGVRRKKSRKVVCWSLKTKGKKTYTTKGRLWKNITQGSNASVDSSIEGGCRRTEGFGE